MKDNTTKQVALLMALFLVGLFFVNSLSFNSHNNVMNREEMRNHFISMRQDIQDEERHNGMYRCCLEKPCTYCIEKTPGHGEGASCDCIADLMAGVHPCGECIGEILEGHGNPYLAEYFATAIAEKTGERDAIARIIEAKYGISVENQI